MCSRHWTRADADGLWVMGVFCRHGLNFIDYRTGSSVDVLRRNFRSGFGRQCKLLVKCLPISQLPDHLYLSMSKDTSNPVWRLQPVGIIGVLCAPRVQFLSLLSQFRYAYAMLDASEVSASAVIIESVLFDNLKWLG